MNPAQFVVTLLLFFSQTEVPPVSDPGVMRVGWV